MIWKVNPDCLFYLYAQKRDLFSSPFTHLLCFWQAWQSAFRLYYTFDEKLQLKLQTCSLVLHIDRSAWHTYLDSHLTHVQLGMCRTPLCRSCTFWFTGAPNNKWCHHNNLHDWWKIWNGWVFGVSFVWVHKGWFHDGKLWEWNNLMTMFNKEFPLSFMSSSEGRVVLPSHTRLLFRALNNFWTFCNPSVMMQLSGKTKHILENGPKALGCLLISKFQCPGTYWIYGDSWCSIFQQSLRFQVRMAKYLAKILPRSKKIKRIFMRMGASWHCKMSFLNEFVGAKKVLKSKQKEW